MVPQTASQKITVKVAASIILSLFMTFTSVLPFDIPLFPLSLDSVLFWLLPLVSFFVLAYTFLPLAGQHWTGLPVPLRRWLGLLTLAAGCAAALAVPSRTVFLFVVNLASFSSLAFLLSLAARRGLVFVLEGKLVPRLLAGWALGSFLAFWLTGFLANFYVEGYQFVLLSMLTTALCGLAGYLLAGQLLRVFRQGVLSFWVEILAVTFLLAAIVFAFQIGSQVPNLFDRTLFLMQLSRLPAFLLVALLMMPWLTAGLAVLNQTGTLAAFRKTRLAVFMRENMFGLLLAGMFAVLYFILSIGLNSFEYFLDENILSSDNSSWIIRMGAADLANMDMRAVHPLAYLLFRPLVAFLSLSMNGSRTYPVLLLNASAGGAGIFLAWYFMRRLGYKNAYAVLIASILGATTAHLVFGAVVETYIFSAGLLLLFFVLLQNPDRPLPGLVAVSVAVFGVTVTNLAQTTASLFAVRPDFKKLVRYGLYVIVLSVALTFVNNLIYPNTGFFFQPGQVSSAESHYTKSYINEPAWRIVGRIYSLVRHMVLYSIVAPQPIFLHEDDGYDIPRTVFFEVTREHYKGRNLEGLARILDDSRQIYRNSKFVGIGKPTEYIWVAVMGLGGLLALWKFIRKPAWGFPVAFVFCLVINFVLHFFYGSDPSLYLAHWTYALVLFVAMGLEKLANMRWLHLVLLVLFGLLLVNNLVFIQAILNSLSPYLP